MDRPRAKREIVMRALVYHGPGVKAWEDVLKPEVAADTDAIVRVDATTICGTDLHILKGDVPAVIDGRILGHDDFDQAYDVFARAADTGALKVVLSRMA
jgi:hypothetical protein